MIFKAILIAAFSFSMIPPQGLPGQEAATQIRSSSEAFQRLLTDLWEKKYENRSAGEQLCESEAIKSSASVADLSAAGAFLIQHNRSRLGAQIAEQLLKVDRAQLRGWDMKIWFNTLMDKYDVSLTSLRAIGPILKADKQLSEGQKRRLVDRLGRTVGFLEGPVKDQVDEVMLEEVEEFLKGHLSDQQLETYTKAKEKVTLKFDNIAGKNQDRIIKEKEQVRIQDDIEKRNLTERNVDLDRQISGLNPQIQNVQNEGTRQVSLARQEMQPLQSQLGLIGSQINRDEAALITLTNDLVFFQQNFPNSLNATLVQNSLRNVRFNLNNLYRQARFTRNQLTVAQARVVQVQNEFDARVSALRDEVRLLQREKSRNRKKLAKLAAGPKVASGKLSAFQHRETSFKNYVEYPVEFLRQDLLAEFGK